MIYILFSICCSVIVSMLLKLAKRYQINVLQAVCFNYLSAAALATCFFNPRLSDVIQTPTLLSLSLGVLLPILFLILASSVRVAGIAKTDIAQRLSLFIPVIAAIYLFGESFNTYKIAGLAVGFLAIILILIRQARSNKYQQYTFFPIMVFLGFGLVDVLFKQLALQVTVPYTTALVSIFLLAFIVAASFMFYKIFTGKEKFQLINLICGLILGAFNFGNILFYLKAHHTLSTSPSVVFAAMNMGVVVIGSIVGIFIFKEQLSRMNYAGVILALLAILLITLSIQHAI